MRTVPLLRVESHADQGIRREGRLQEYVWSLPRFISRINRLLVGDFGLATSSLAVVEPADVLQTPAVEADMTLGELSMDGCQHWTNVYEDVGTRLYIAAEVQSAESKARNHAKADMYSLGVRYVP